MTDLQLHLLVKKYRSYQKTGEPMTMQEFSDMVEELLRRYEKR